jgi:phosphatidylserine/phosphatidylglycerophosphate/cardiolipin synthase-like enzyme
MASATDRLDRLIGDGLERAVRAHHGRRLRRVGWGNVLDVEEEGTWAAPYPPPRRGNRVEVLIDGSEALPAIAEAVSGARSHVHVAGWHVAPHFALVRGERRRTVRDILAEAAERVPVRVLAWAGAPVPVFHPTRPEVREARDALCQGTRIRCGLDSRERPMHCHHEKLVIVDDEVAFVGGIDLTDLAGDRYDEPGHPDRGALGWHDVATRLHGPVVGDVADHFGMRWHETTGETLAATVAPAQPEAGPHEVQIVRTVPEKVYDAVPRGDFRLLQAYLRALRSARRLIYLESQFLWSPEIVAVLADKLRHPPADEFRMVIVLPSRPNDGADDTRGQLGVLVEADGAGDRLLVCALYAHDGGDPSPVYVHAKVGIVDDRWLTIGSANLNEHSLFNDTEVNLVCPDPDLARATRERLWAEHLGVSVEEAGADPRDVIDRLWKPVAHEQLRRRQSGAPMTARIVRLPGVSKRAGRLRGPLESLVVDG